MQRDEHNQSNNTNLLLVTWYDNDNHGNRLQHYAMQTILKSLGFKVDSLCCPHFRESSSGIMYDLKIARRRFFAYLGVKKYRRFFNGQDNFKIRFKRFEEFSEKYIDGKIIVDFEEVLKSDKSQWNKYFKVIVGSDQVWNIQVIHKAKMLEYFYLSFVEREKRVNYAPSFGCNYILDEHFEIHKKGLLGFDKLSCREKSGCEIIKKITGLDSQLVLDPTLILTVEQWRSISRKPSYNIPEHYMMTYFLGFKTSEELKAISNVKNDLEIIEIHDRSDKEHYLTDPQEFLWLVDHADFICTDSFHGTLFSIKFKKDFISFGKYRKGRLLNTFARIDNILSICGLSDRVYDPEKDICEILKSSINYSNVEERLKPIKDISIKYLCTCLNIEYNPIKIN